MIPKLVVRNGRSPFQFALVAVSATAGALGLALPGPGPSNNVSRIFGDHSPWFYVALLGSSLIVFGGMVHPRVTADRFRLGMEIERIGLWPLGGATLAYATTNLAVAGQTALVSALLTAGIGIAGFVRICIITVDLRRITELLDLEARHSRSPRSPVPRSPGRSPMDEPATNKQAPNDESSSDHAAHDHAARIQAARIQAAHDQAAGEDAARGEGQG